MFISKKRSLSKSKKASPVKKRSVSKKRSGSKKASPVKKRSSSMISDKPRKVKFAVTAYFKGASVPKLKGAKNVEVGKQVNFAEDKQTFVDITVKSTDIRDVKAWIKNQKNFKRIHDVYIFN